MELLLKNNCVLCHSDSEIQNSRRSLFPFARDNQTTWHMNLKDLVEDIHFQAVSLARVVMVVIQPPIWSRIRQAMARERSHQESSLGRRVLRALSFRSCLDASVQCRPAYGSISEIQGKSAWGIVTRKT
jgi:hypothetical protein